MAARALAEIAEIQTTLDDAVDTLLELAEAGITVSREAPEDTASIIRAFGAIRDICGFRDLAGQRLARLAETLNGAQDSRPDAALLNGPQARADAPDQAAIDAMFEAADPAD